MSTLIKRTKYTETKEAIDAAVDSIIGHAALETKVPDTTSDFKEIVRKSTDGWAKALDYIRDSDLIENDAICNRKSTDLIIDDCTTGKCTTIKDVAFIIISGGENFTIQTKQKGDTVKVYELDEKVEKEPYDDVVKWVLLNELRIKISCDSPLRILNNELAPATNGSAYSSEIFVEGGVPFTGSGKYEWCRQESGTTGLTFDPDFKDSDCLKKSSWGIDKEDTLKISGMPASSGSFLFTFFARDKEGNTTDRSMVLTVKD